jgi:hypothetical protein
LRSPYARTRTHAHTHTHTHTRHALHTLDIQRQANPAPHPQERSRSAPATTRARPRRAAPPAAAAYLKPGAALIDLGRGLSGRRAADGRALRAGDLDSAEAAHARAGWLALARGGADRLNSAMLARNALACARANLGLGRLQSSRRDSRAAPPLAAGVKGEAAAARAAFKSEVTAALGLKSELPTDCPPSPQDDDESELDEAAPAGEARRAASELGSPLPPAPEPGSPLESAPPSPASAASGCESPAAAADADRRERWSAQRSTRSLADLDAFSPPLGSPPPLPFSPATAGLPNRWG